MLPSHRGYAARTGGNSRFDKELAPWGAHPGNGILWASPPQDKQEVRAVQGAVEAPAGCQHSVGPALVLPTSNGPSLGTENQTRHSSQWRGRQRCPLCPRGKATESETRAGKQSRPFIGRGRRGGRGAPHSPRAFPMSCSHFPGSDMSSSPPASSPPESKGDFLRVLRLGSNQ